MQVKYVPYESSNFPELHSMSRKLWTDFDEDQLEELLKKNAELETTNFLLAKNEDGKCLGFAIFSIRTDYVEGALSSPTGYLEGIFVEADYRKLGIAKSFVQIGETWCKSKGCTQMGSDTWLNDTKSREFHKKVGFWEEEEVVHFLKNL